MNRLRVCARVQPLRLVAGVVWLLWMVVPVLGQAEQWTGQVVGLSDGDTLSVMRAGKAVKVRLHGVDTPEKAQAFGTQARQFTGELVFQQTVTVAIRDTDRYGRLVGEVLLPDGRSLNQELVKAGLAWWYRQYAPHDPTLAHLEAEARSAKRGLWADADPVPPWAWRKGQRAAVPAAAAPTHEAAPLGAILGNKRSKIYHEPACPDYEKVAPQNRVPFQSREEAKHAGYRRAGNCP
jgi:endonuclease YncB( thermonuclease family)